MTTTLVQIHDITINGSLVGEGNGIEQAESEAARISLAYPGRLVRVHKLCGIDVHGEFRNGEKVVGD